MIDESTFRTSLKKYNRPCQNNIGIGLNKNAKNINQTNNGSICGLNPPKCISPEIFKAYNVNATTNKIEKTPAI